MGKLIFFAVIGIIIYYIIKGKGQNKEEYKDDAEFVQCEECHTFVLKKELKEKNGKLVCRECYENIR